MLIHPKRKVFIYGLFDETGIRYVGKTVTPLAQRLASHLIPANLNYNTHKNQWIKQLKRRGLKPDIRLLETIEPENFDNWQAREQAWISFGRRIGWRLTNVSSGGDAGGNGVKHTEETKQIMSEKRKQFLKDNPQHLTLIAPKPGRYSEATLKKMSESALNRYADPQERQRHSLACKGKSGKRGYNA